jgi:hypothetical protein
MDPSTEAYFARNKKVESIHSPFLCPQGEHVIIVLVVLMWSFVGLWKGHLDRDWGQIGQGCGRLRLRDWTVNQVGGREWTSAIKHPFHAVVAVAALAMVVTRLDASADGKP